VFFFLNILNVYFKKFIIEKMYTIANDILNLHLNIFFLI